MKQLLTLISFLFILTINSETISYEIKEGDTLYSIAKDNGLSLNDIFKANEDIGFNQDYIYPKKIIKLPLKKINIFHNICYSRIGLIQFHPYKSHEEVTKECLNALKKEINTKNIDYLNANEKELLYLINKEILDFISSDGPIKKFDILKSSSLVKAADSGNTKAAFMSYRMLDLIDKKFSDFVYDKTLKTILDTKQPAEKRVSACTNLHNNSNLSDYDLTLYFYLMCTDILYDLGNNKYIKFDNFLVDLILSNESQIVKIFEIYAISNVMYHRLNTNNEKGAFKLNRDYISIKCPDCNESVDLFNIYAERYTKVFAASEFTTALYYFILNGTSAYYSVKGITPELLVEYRDDIINRFYDGDNLKPDSNLNDLGISTAFLSDTALKLIQWNECDLASRYLDKAITNYQDDYYDNSNEDYFIEPLYLASCFLHTNKKEYTREDVHELLEKAIKYRNISEKALDEYDISNPISLALLKTIRIMLELFLVNTEITEQTFNNFKDLSTLLREAQIYDFAGDIENFDLLTGIYLEIYDVFYHYENVEKLQHINLDGIIDPVSLYQMRNRFEINSQLVNLKLSKTDENLIELQNKLKNNNYKIKNLDQEKFSYQDMLNLYKENSSLIEEILSLDDNLKSLKSPQIESISSIQNSLQDNEYAYFLLPTNVSTFILLISKNEFHYWRKLSYGLIKPGLDEFIKSMNPDANFDFELAEMLGSILFPFIDDERFISKGSTIYLYTDGLIGIPPSVFVKSYNNSSSISEYERLLTAKWFINDYNFTTRLPYKNNSQAKETKPFLGIGNSTSYDWVGLPNLNEVNEEITSLALNSYASKDDILLNKNATKEQFLDKLNYGYDRVVISTHSVPPNWQGVLDEPALVFNSISGDYFLTPSEIINTDLNSDMVVLSSCNASIDGFDDLYKSFLIAGSKSVVHSNWNLESKYAKEFTTSFFKELWLNDKNKHEAIRTVSLQFLNDYSNQRYAHPAYWGNFSIVYSSVN